MSTISATNTSTNSAIVSLLKDAASSGGATVSQRNTASSPNTPSASSSDTVDLSGHAKLVLARAKTEQFAADKLNELLQSLRGANGKTSSLGSKSSDGYSSFDQLTGRLSQSGKSGGQSDGSRIWADAYGNVHNFAETILDNLVKQHTRPDGTYENFSVSVSDLYTGPTTPEESQLYLKSRGLGIDYEANEVAANDQVTASQKAEAQAMQQAYHNGTLQVMNAADIPGLNFHNTVTFSGGPVGFQSNGTFSYNRNASIFSDPTTYYRVSSDGVVLAWSKASASS